MSTIDQKIAQFRKKYFFNILVKGIIWLAITLLSGYLLASFAEYWGNFSTSVRTAFMIIYLALLTGSLFYWVLQPLYRFFDKNELKPEKASQMIGRLFPSVQDKLLNIIQLRNQKTENNNGFIEAAIEQRSSEFQNIQFSSGIRLQHNVKYLKYLIGLLIIFFCIFYLKPAVFTETAPRLAQFQTHFAPKAPFTFELQNTSRQVFRNENFTIRLKITGEELPESALVSISDRSGKPMIQTSDSTFQWTISNVNEDFSFYFQALNFSSQEYNIQVRDMPSVMAFNSEISYPAYTQRKNETVENTGSLVIPQGTVIRWKVEAAATEKLAFRFDREKEAAPAQLQDENTFVLSKKVMQSQGYRIEMENEYKKVDDQIEFFLTVIPDYAPKIKVSTQADTVFYEYLDVFGSLSDDYGLTSAALHYAILEKQDTAKAIFTKMPIDNIQKNTSIQNFLKRLPLKKIGLKSQQTLQYYVEVWDNDQVNGAKKTVTPMFYFQLPDEEAIKKDLEEEKQKTENKMSNNKKDIQDLSETLEKTYDALKTKTQLNWADSKKLKNIAEESKKMRQEIEQMKEAYKKMFAKEQKSSVQTQNESLKKQSDELQKLIDDLLSEEDKEMFEEMEELLKEENYTPEVSNLLKKMMQKHKDLKENLERTLALFQKLKLESKIFSAIQDLKKIRKKEEKFSKSMEKSKKKDLAESEKAQSENQKEWEDTKEKLADLDSLAQKLNADKHLKNMDSLKKEIDQEYENIKDALKKGKKSKAQSQQRKKQQKQKQLQQQLQSTLDALQKDMVFENYDNLRRIFDNLLKLSFDQEGILLGFRKTYRTDPGFVSLSQRQLELKKDMKMIKDSLMSLAKRVTQIESFITKKVQETDYNMDEGIEAIKRRDVGSISVKLQYTMTSINDLALLLTDLLNNMRMQMSMMMPGQQNSQQPSGQKQSLSQQQKDLNGKMEQLMKSNQKGKGLSKELGELVAEQEKIRQQLEKESEKGRQDLGEEDGQSGMKAIIKKMKETELDLVNKRLTSELIQRQKEILTRLLKSEKAKRERGYDRDRESNTGDQNLQSDSKKALEEYLKSKEKQIELLRSLYLEIHPYYKKKVEEYLSN